MPKFRNKSGRALTLNKPSSSDAHTVDIGELLSVPGAVDDLPDAYVVGVGADACAYQKSNWELVEDDKPKSFPTAKKAAGNKKEGE